MPNTVFVGVDVSSQTLEVANSDQVKTEQVSNANSDENVRNFVGEAYHERK